MSGLTDYSKWDALDSDVESDTEEDKSPTILNTSSTVPPPGPSPSADTPLPPTPDAPHLGGAHLQEAMSSSFPSPDETQHPPTTPMTKKSTEKGRYVYAYQGRTVYEVRVCFLVAKRRQRGREAAKRCANIAVACANSG